MSIRADLLPAFWIDREENLGTLPIFQRYVRRLTLIIRLEQCQSDLAALKEWGNLTTIYDSSRATSQEGIAHLLTENIARRRCYFFFFLPERPNLPGGSAACAFNILRV